MAANHRLQLRRINHALGAACRSNSIEDLRQFLRTAKTEYSPDEYRSVLDRAMYLALYYRTADLAKYLITEEDASADNDNLSVFRVSELRSPIVWSELLARGWDINQRGPNFTSRLEHKRLIDYVCDDEALVRWCLDHGAAIDDDHDNRLEWPPILECVAENGSVSTLKLLRERGAPMSRRMLHLAARGAGGRSGDNSRMEMLRYLVDELRLDVNQMDADTALPDHSGSPLCYAIWPRGGTQAVQFLLDRGADPSLHGPDGGPNAFEKASLERNEDVQNIMKEWLTAHA
ncbi:hypothetical protein BDV59DRAFT_197592 [Aspergillus ambiguus]|uniref:uncharacterized protein n=1 Tax=Aspergillus ambiguus TaxID=176160 RepID=UPI003CCDD79B